MKSDRPIRILFLSANPVVDSIEPDSEESLAPLALGEEARAIETKLRAAGAGPAIEFITKWAVRPDDLLQWLNLYQPHIVHFSGHGSRTAQIILVDDQGNPKPVGKAALVSLFQTLQGNIRLVVLNACYARAQALAVTEVIDCAVGMNKAIGDQAAITFAAAFYRAIGFGCSVKAAFEQGKTALLLEGIPEQNTPELLVRQGIDPSRIHLIGSAEEPPSTGHGPDPATLPPPSLPEKPYFELIGRTEEQVQVLSVLRGEGAALGVEVVGMGGIGKTSLAHEIAERALREKLFESVVWTSAKTEELVEGRILSRGELRYDFDGLLSDIGRQMGHPEIATLPREEKKQALGRTLASHRVLIVMDNLETVPENPSLVSGVLALLGAGRLLLTSRHRIFHERLYTLELRGLSRENCILFLQVEGRQRNIPAVTQASRAALTRIHAATGGAPLALKLVMGQLSRQPLDVILQMLEEASAKGQDEEFYRFVYWHSWSLLNEESRKALVDLSAFPPMTGGTARDVEKVSQVERPVFWSAIGQLVNLCLVEKTGPAGRERFALHALTHHFVLADITEEWLG
ncbi:MAG TPA: NB-ARC domain-containing protein [Thermoanaerobaculia bacterium]|nr:NB-ARC domain-containing protein [Thermoanaerobaculia bacterium]